MLCCILSYSALRAWPSFARTRAPPSGLSFSFCLFLSLSSSILLCPSDGYIRLPPLSIQPGFPVSFQFPVGHCVCALLHLCPFPFPRVSLSSSATTVRNSLSRIPSTPSRYPRCFCSLFALICIYAAFLQACTPTYVCGVRVRVRDARE